MASKADVQAVEAGDTALDWLIDAKTRLLVQRNALAAAAAKFVGHAQRWASCSDARWDTLFACSEFTALRQALADLEAGAAPAARASCTADAEAENRPTGR